MQPHVCATARDTFFLSPCANEPSATPCTHARKEPWRQDETRIVRVDSLSRVLALLQYIHACVKGAWTCSLKHACSAHACVSPDSKLERVCVFDCLYWYTEKQACTARTHVCIHMCLSACMSIGLSTWSVRSGTTEGHGVCGVCVCWFVCASVRASVESMHAHVYVYPDYCTWSLAVFAPLRLIIPPIFHTPSFLYFFDRNRNRDQSPIASEHSGPQLQREIYPTPEGCTAQPTRGCSLASTYSLIHILDQGSRIVIMRANRCGWTVTHLDWANNCFSGTPFYRWRDEGASNDDDDRNAVCALSHLPRLQKCWSASTFCLQTLTQVHARG